MKITKHKLLKVKRKMVNLSSAFIWSIMILTGITSMSLWAFISPVGSSPDDDFHLASIWCYEHELPTCQITEPSATITVPSAFTNAKCQLMLQDASKLQECIQLDNSVQTTNRYNKNHRYPGGFYFVLNKFVNQNVFDSVLVMRLFNVLLFISLLVGILLTRLRSRRREVWIPLIFGLIPLGNFIIASTNPSSWVVYSPAVVFISVLSAIENKGFIRIANILIGILGFLLSISARWDGIIYVSMALIAVFLLKNKGKLRAKYKYIYLSVFIFFSSIFILNNKILFPVWIIQSLPNFTILERLKLGISNLVSLHEIVLGSSGTTPLGWLNIQNPSVVPILIIFTVTILFVKISSKLRRVEKFTLFLLIAPIVLLPLFYLQIRHQEIKISSFQTRYILPLIILLFSVSVFMFKDKLNSLGSKTILILTSFMFLANTLSFASASVNFDKISVFFSSNTSIENFVSQNTTLVVMMFALTTALFYACLLNISKSRMSIN